MSEVPEGMSLGPQKRRPPRLTATMTLTRDGEDGIEVLLGLRSETMAAFPGYWAFPGGGLSRVDTAAVETLEGFEGPEAKVSACILREMSEELGLAPSGNGLVALPPEARKEIVADKSRYLPLAQQGAFPYDTRSLRLLCHRITPPFGPIQFDNAFMHIHAGLAKDVPEIDLDPQTEFTQIMWARPTEFLLRWSNHEMKVAPPVVTLLMEIEQTLERKGRNMLEAARDISERLPGRRSILFAHGVEVVPVKTATLPPADHTNCYLVGDPEGEFILVDPASHLREGVEYIAKAVDRHKGQLVAMMFTHSHGDHVGDIGLLRDAFDVPIWGSEYTARSVECDRILSDGELLELGDQTWQVLITPGHHPGHICLLGDAGLIAGDMVAGIGTILIPPHTGDMNVYMEQLERLKNLKPHLLFPSHGPVIALPTKKFNQYLSHRQARHQAVYDAVQSGIQSLPDIAKAAYADTPDAHPVLAIDQTLSHLMSHQRAGTMNEHSSKWSLNGTKP
jgi:glyoxylase-like metal-dependent hydrolase (beta-lactamase superfamily II)/8-oxo-dGTP pyrophosphatase MutT (NUDIX family)